MKEEQIGCGVSLREAMPLGKETPMGVIQQIGVDGLSGGLGDVCFYASYDCNLDCYMCLVKHMKGRKIPKMSMDQIKDGFKDVKTLFHLGGEPWVTENMMEMVEYFDSQGINQIMSTNGTKITKEIAEKLAGLENFVNIQVSLNAADELDGKIRGWPKSFERTTESIKLLVDAGLSTWIHCTIVNENINELAKVVKLGAELGVSAVNFIFAHVTTEEEIKTSKELMKKWIGEDVEIKGYVGELGYSEEQLINSINAAKEEGKKTGVQVMFFSKIFGDNPEIYWQGTLLDQAQPICQLTLMPPLTPNVGPDGSVYNCPYIVKSFGNINEISLKEIWDSETIRNFRKGMISNKLLPICRRCPCSDIIDVSASMEHELLDLTKWIEYIGRLTKEFSELPEVPPILNSIEPTIFQYSFNDHPELNFWHAFDKNGIRGGMGENTEDINYIKLIHKADFEVVRKVFSGEQNPIKATMAGNYLVEGDMAKLMACAPLLPLQVVAHEKVMGSTSGSENSAVCSTMEWQQEVKQIYEKVVLGIPEAVRPVVKAQLLEAAEKKCIDRDGDSVAEVDLIVGLFEITPPAFKPTVIEDLVKLGIDYDRYSAKVTSDFKCKNDLDQMVKDLVKIGEIVEVKSNVDAIWKVIKAYEEFFAGAPVSVRTTTKPVGKRDVAIRYVEFFVPHNPNPYITAINEGLIEKNGHPIHEMIVEAIDKFQIMGYGVDLDISKGMSKIWPFVVPESIDEVLSMKTIPESIRNYEEYFKKHGLTTFALFAFDFLHKTTNIYFMLKQPPKTTYKNCVALVKDLGFEISTEEIMKACCTAAHLNYTFNWDSEKCERLCFGIPEDDFKDVPVHLHPLMKNFVDKTPLQSEKQKFVWGVTFTPNGLYYKIENDYNGTMVDFIAMGCKAGLDYYK